MGEEWDDSLQSKEQIEANLLNKYEAAMRRERALAYSFSHQVINFPNYFNLSEGIRSITWLDSLKFSAIVSASVL